MLSAMAMEVDSMFGSPGDFDPSFGFSSSSLMSRAKTNFFPR